MGFNKNNEGIKVKLTPYGKRFLLTNSVNEIKYFGLGDSDIDYNAIDRLENSINLSGDLSFDGVNKNVYYNTNIKYKLLNGINSSPLKKIDRVEPLETETYLIEHNPIILHEKIKTRTSTKDKYANLVNNLGVNMTYSNYESISKRFGNNSLKYLIVDDLMILPIDSDQYSEIIDGRDITIRVGEKMLVSKYDDSAKYETLLSSFSEPNMVIKRFFNENVAFLFESTEEVHHKEGFKEGQKTFKFTGEHPDVPVGVVFLDKGFVVFLDKNLIEYSVNNDVMFYYNSVSYETYQNITCPINKDEFLKSLNPTFDSKEVYKPLITEIGIYDMNKNLIALGKLPKPIERNSETVKIVIKLSY